MSGVARLVQAMSEAEFQRQVTDLAEVLGCSWAHFRPAQTKHGWRTPVSGPLGAGFPDFVLLRVRDRRLIFAELKREGQKPTANQAAVLAALGELGGWWFDQAGTRGLRVEVHVWHPSDLRDPIETSPIYVALHGNDGGAR